jgi:EmrB/QacA subfamily drug resistance transporter
MSVDNRPMPVSEPTERPDASLGVRGWLTLVTLCGATFMTGLDYSIVTVAMPEIGRDLGFDSTSHLQWIVTAFLLATAALLPLGGRLADVVGRRTMFIAGVVIFTTCSLVAGVAASPEMLIVARAGQGVGAAAIGPTAIALMATAFPEGPQRTRAFAVNGALLSLGFIVGTIGGGIVTNGLSWRWTMLILVAMGSVVLVGAVALISEAGDRSARRVDAPGALLAGGGLFALVYAVSTGADAGWRSVSTLGSLVASAILLAAFLVVESRHPAPLIPLRLLNRPTVKWSALVGLVTFSMVGGATLLLTLYMQDVLGFTSLETGFAFIAEGMAAVLGGYLAARMIARRGPARTMAVGLVVQAASIGAMAFLSSEGNLLLLLGTSGAMGLGHLLVVVSFIDSLTSGLRDDEQGVAGILTQLPLYVGGVGIAILAAIATARTDALATTDSDATAILGGLHAAIVAAAVISLVGLTAVAALSKRPNDRRPVRT